MSAGDSFDFGDGPEAMKGNVIMGAMDDAEVISKDFCKCCAPSTWMGRSLLSTHVSQRECLTNEAKLTIGNTATAANIPKLRSELERHLAEVPCFVVHYGVYETDFESLMALGRAIEAESPGKIPIAFFAPKATGKGVIAAAAIPAAVMDGVSIFYHVENQTDFEALAHVFARCAAAAAERTIDISPIRAIFIIDRTAGYSLGQLIRDEGDDRVYLVDDDGPERSNQSAKRFELATKYLPQVSAMQDTAATMMTKDWEAKMSTHTFRNAHYPPTAIEIAKFPLDQLSFLLAFQPFGASFVIATMLLPDKGPQVRELLEAWINAALGTPVRFIKAD